MGSREILSGGAVLFTVVFLVFAIIIAYGMTDNSINSGGSSWFSQNSGVNETQLAEFEAQQDIVDAYADDENLGVIDNLVYFYESYKLQVKAQNIIRGIFLSNAVLLSILGVVTIIIVLGGLYIVREFIGFS